MLRIVCTIVLFGGLMFENVSFVDVSTKDYPSKGSFSIPEKGESSLLPALSAQDIRDLASISMSADFRMSGTLRLMTPLPSVPSAISGLLHIQSFSVMRSGRGYYTNRLSSETFLLLTTYEGRGRLLYRGDEYSFGAGEGFLIDCREPHRYETDGDVWEHGDLHFDGPTARAFFDAICADDGVGFRVSGDIQDRLENALETYQAIRTGRELHVHVALTELLSLLLASREREVSGSMGMRETIRELAIYIQEHSSEQLSMDELSKAASVSKYHLSREFKRYMGCSPMQYLIMLRLENAAALLRGTSLPLSAIAETVGIGSEQYLARMFKRHNGITPGQFRKGC